jgi:ABC-2 type transport system permease protein
MRYGLTFIVPVAFATTIPAEALTSRLGWETLLGAVLLPVSRRFCRLGLWGQSGTTVWGVTTPGCPIP